MTGQARVYTASLDEAELRRVLNERRADLTTIYLESETRITLTPLESFIGPKITLPPVRWIVGRAFGPSLEIRWNVDGAQSSQFEAAALTESDNAPKNWQSSAWNTQLDPQAHPRNVLLAGMNAAALPPDQAFYRPHSGDGVWIDLRLPRPLAYPVNDPKADRVMLRCLDYTSRGLVVLTRLCEVAPYSFPTT